jgi:hypothetical protein
MRKTPESRAILAKTTVLPARLKADMRSQGGRNDSFAAKLKGDAQASLDGPTATVAASFATR